MLVGYCRVSSAGQSLEVQQEQLKVAGAERIFAEKRSGARAVDRAALQEALGFVREGDTLLVTRIDRLARSLTDLVGIAETLSAKGVGLRATQQTEIDTTSAHGKLLLGILGTVAEFERTLLKERQAEGIAKAKAAGKYKGRPCTVDAEAIRAEMAKPGAYPAAVAKKLGVARSTVYRLAQDLIEAAGGS